MCKTRYHHLERAFKLLDNVGAQYRYEVTHIIKIFVTVNNRTRMFVANKTPGDINAEKQIERDARRLIAQMQQ